jgi:FkbM family methyltransferase
LRGAARTDVLAVLRPHRLVWWLLRKARNPWAVRLRALPLVGAGIHLVSHQLWPTGRRTWASVSEGAASGLTLLIDPRYDAKLAAGTVEQELQARLVDLVAPGSVAWDVGAHVGFFALTFARLVGPSGEVVAFEADEANVAALRAAVVRNGFDNVEVRPVAVWSTPGKVVFERRADTGGALNGAVVQGGRGVTVGATTLDAELAGRRTPDLVKIDVEGAEAEVLIGSTRLLSEIRPIIVCEVHVSRRGHEDLLSSVLTLFEASGYAVEDIDPGHLPAHLLAVPL